MWKKKTYEFHNYTEQPGFSESISDDVTPSWSCFPSFEKKTRTKETDPVVHQTTVKTLEYRSADISKNNLQNGDSRQHISLVSKLERELEVCRNDLRKCRQEKEELLSRLSQVMGNQLANDNPQLTNLNDQNRPQKLSDMLGDLYDYAWTDAFSELQTVDDNFNQRICSCLLCDILKISYDGCLDYVHSFSEHINKWFEGKKVCQTRHVLDFAVSTADSTVPSIQADMMEVIREKYSEKVLAVCKDFIQRCVYISFYMVTKSPVMHLDFLCQTDIDKTFFKPFTKDGEKLDYCVWPALFLYKDGPLISKGVVQCL